ncbi:hypothetical protein AAGR22_10640 [Erwinia sp. HDF1-3R]|uniref:hypothetical protein n=1 Tax=Erwinia sp. HDF1-3R TaxID=3141543 RepID=UPI0031F4CF93
MNKINRITTPANILTVASKANQKKDNFPNQISTVTQSSISMNRHGNTFQGFDSRTNFTRPGSIKNVNASSVEKDRSEKKLHNPLNRHGNTFQGFDSRANFTRPGSIKNVNASSVEKDRSENKLYNPLNQHGNTFQGLDSRANFTRPGSIKNINAPSVEQGRSEKKLYNPLNHHGNTFQGLNALKKAQESDNANFILIKDENGFEGNEIDAHLFEDYPLFDKADEVSYPKAAEELEETKTAPPLKRI